MKQLFREPLVHFLLLGAGLFVAFGLVGKRTSGESGKIVITQGQIEYLAAGYNRVHGRPALPEELEGLIRDYVREEVYCREALALGLDRDDPVIRNRLRLKMEFISDDVAAQAEPTDEQLRSYLREHPDAFGIEPRFTFSQVYLNPERHRENLTHDAAQLLMRLNQVGDKSDVSELGDPFLLEHTFVALAASEVAKQFGEKFAAKLGELPRDQWQGPVESGYGVHLVFVSETTEGHVPTLEEVRNAVRREWANARRLAANEKFYQEVLKRYTVTIEPPQLTKAGKKLAMEARR
jgi:parvulin-like peptidyl-prolyl cis-trans isomerase-like protein